MHLSPNLMTTNLGKRQSNDKSHTTPTSLTQIGNIDNCPEEADTKMQAQGLEPDYARYGMPAYALKTINGNIINLTEKQDATHLPIYHDGTHEYFKLLGLKEML